MQCATGSLTRNVLRRSRGTLLLRDRLFLREGGNSIRTLATLSDPSQNISKPPRHAQPHPTTHPHLLKPDELTPGFTLAEYEGRRAKLMQGLPEGSLVVCMGGAVRLMSGQIFYRFRQSTNFFYLTGLQEPDCTLILESRPSTSKGYHSTLYLPPTLPSESLWSGARPGPSGAPETFGVDEAFSNHLLPSHLKALLAGREKGEVFVELPPATGDGLYSSPYPARRGGGRGRLSKLFSAAEQQGKLFAGSETVAPHLMLHEMVMSRKGRKLEEEVEKLRVVKSEAEIRVMKQACDLSSLAHTEVMKFAAPDKTEAQLGAHFEYVCGMGGSLRPAYVPVVASGANALVIHYVNNDCVLRDGELVLIDAGCEFSSYTSDITRTFPVSGRFSPAQADLYTAVLNTQKQCIKKCEIGEEMDVNELHKLSVGWLGEELRQIGFKVTGSEVERKLYPHFLSHHLGADLHDCNTWPRHAKLEAGHVITIEPGCYVPFDSSFPKHFHGIGIRIEDDVAFTKDGPLVLSANAPKEIVDVEAACQDFLKR